MVQTTEVPSHLANFATSEIQNERTRDYRGVFPGLRTTFANRVSAGTVLPMVAHDEHHPV